nr:MAG TPA: hypothetical protein [Siphoviridae sp. ctQHO9]
MIGGGSFLVGVTAFLFSVLHLILVLYSNIRIKSIVFYSKIRIFLLTWQRCNDTILI